MQQWPGIIETYRQFLDIEPTTPSISLQEGHTPLLFAPHISQMVGTEVFLKIEGANPTGSFKDRGMTLAISKAKAAGVSTVICASTGNTSASAAAYASRAELSCVVLVPAGKVALGKLAQAFMYGALVIQVKSNFDRALDLVRQLKDDACIVNSINPDRIEGQKTAAYEIVDSLGEAPDALYLPVGNAGNITAYGRGFNDYLQAGKIKQLPRLCGWQAQGAAPLVNGADVEDPQTLASAIRIGKPASAHLAKEVVKQSGGFFRAVSDEEILHAYRLLGEKEGVFCEPASAAGVAGLLKDKPKVSRVVCVLTGNGLKDPQSAIEAVPPPIELEADIASIRSVLSL